MLYYSYTLMFSLVLQHCCYVVVCRFVRSLMAFVCQEIKDYLLTYFTIVDHPQSGVVYNFVCLSDDNFRKPQCKEVYISTSGISPGNIGHI